MKKILDNFPIFSEQETSFAEKKNTQYWSQTTCYLWEDRFNYKEIIVNSEIHIQYALCVIKKITLL